MSLAQHILCIDTAMGACSVCYADHAKDFTVVISELMKHGQAERLMPMIGEVLEQAQAMYSDIDAIVTTVGPGGFTGLRVGLSAAKALGLALDIPVYGLSSFQALAASYVLSDLSQQGDFTVLIDSRRDDFYVQHFGMKGAPKSAPFLDDGQNLETESILMGDAVERFLSVREDKSIQAVDIVTPDIKNTARFALNNVPYVLNNPEPIYMRGADVSVSKKKQRVLAQTDFV